MNIEITNEVPAIAIAMKKEAVSFTNMAGVMDEMFSKLWACVAQQGLEIVEAPYCKYTNGNEDFTAFDIELGIPVNKAVPGEGEIYMSKTAEGRAITAIHKGAYKDIEETYAPMMEYLATNKLESTEVYYDYYISNPADTPESELLTRVVFPIQ